MRAALPLMLAAAIAGRAIAAPPKTVVFEPVRGLTDADRTTSGALKYKTDRWARMTVPVKLSGQGPYRFLVDTGADRTAVSTALAAQLGLNPSDTAILHSSTGSQEVRTAIVPGLELGDRVREVEAPLLDAGNMGADGILGVDALRSQRVMFDFKAKTISIVAAKQRLPRDEKGTIVVTGKLRNGHLIVSRAETSGVPLTLVLDTGAEMSIGNAALRARLEKRRKLRNPETIELMSVTGGKLKGEVFFLDSVEVGGATMQGLAVMFADAHTFRTLDLQSKPALLLGMNAMRSFDKVSIDFERKKLRFVVPQESSRADVMMAER